MSCLLLLHIKTRYTHIRACIQPAINVKIKERNTIIRKQNKSLQPSKSLTAESSTFKNSS